MGRNEIEPTGGGPVWPLAPQAQGDLALQRAIGQQTYSEGGGLELTLASVWRILNEWRWLILGAVAVSLAGAIVYTLLTTPMYRATATLEINPPQVQIMQDTTAQPAVSNDWEYLATQYGLLASRSLAQRVAQDLNLGSNPNFASPDAAPARRLKSATGKLMGNFVVTPVESSRLVRISFSSEDPRTAARVTNAYADSFIQSNLERRYEASSYAREFLEGRLAMIKRELEKSERQLVAYAQDQEIISTAASPPGQTNDAASLPGASLVSLNAALASAQQERVAAEQRYRQSRATGVTAEMNQGTSALRQQRAQLETEYQEKLGTFKADYPDMQRLRARIDALDEQIKLEATNVAGGRANTLLAEYQAAVAAERSLQGRVNELKGSVLNLRGRTIQYNILQREVDTNRALYDALLQRYKEIGVAGGIGTNQVSVVDRAQVPGSPYQPNLPLNLVIGLLLGLVGGIGSAFALEFINDTIKTPDDVRNKLHLASLGVIPKKQGAASFSEQLRDQTSSISEAYFSLRTSLQFSTSSGVPKSLLVTSTREAEGKSSTTFALAQNFARLGHSVLLIDSDLRKPAFVTGDEDAGGLSRVLTSAQSVEENMVKTEHDNLWLMPAGPLPPNPAELLASPRLRHVIQQAMDRFDLVIIDGPPILGLADAPLLSAVMHGTLLIVESGRTRSKVVVEAVNRLRASGGNIVGAVLTKYRHQAHGYGYSYEPYRYGNVVGKRDREIRLLAQQDA